MHICCGKTPNAIPANANWFLPVAILVWSVFWPRAWCWRCHAFCRQRQFANRNGPIPHLSSLLSLAYWGKTSEKCGEKSRCIRWKSRVSQKWSGCWNTCCPRFWWKPSWKKFPPIRVVCDWPIRRCIRFWPVAKCRLTRHWPPLHSANGLRLHARARHTFGCGRPPIAECPTNWPIQTWAWRGRWLRGTRCNAC